MQLTPRIVMTFAQLRAKIESDQHVIAPPGTGDDVLGFVDMWQSAYSWKTLAFVPIVYNGITLTANITHHSFDAEKLTIKVTKAEDGLYKGTEQYLDVAYQHTNLEALKYGLLFGIKTKLMRKWKQNAQNNATKALQQYEKALEQAVSAAIDCRA